MQWKYLQRLERRQNLHRRRWRRILLSERGVTLRCLGGNIGRNIGTLGPGTEYRNIDSPFECGGLVLCFGSFHPFQSLGWLFQPRIRVTAGGVNLVLLQLVYSEHTLGRQL